MSRNEIIIIFLPKRTNRFLSALGSYFRTGVGVSWRKVETFPSAAFSNRWRYTSTPPIRIYGLYKNGSNFIHFIPAVLNTQLEITSLDLHWGLFNKLIQGGPWKSSPPSILYVSLLLY